MLCLEQHAIKVIIINFKKRPTLSNFEISFVIYSSSIKPHWGIIRQKISKANVQDKQYWNL